jgi:APA family basic amino acid/polyamine antiporter
LTLCTLLYIITSGLLTGVISYTRLNVGAPIALGMAETGVQWGEFLVLIGTILGLSTVMLVMLLGQSRVFFSMSCDGLLPHWAGAVHPRFRTPWISSIVVGVFVAFLPAMLPIGVLNEMTSIGTLLAFVIVCAGVWVLRVRRPDLHRPFKTPLVPLVLILGIASSLILMIFLPLATWIRLVVWLIIGMVIYLTYGRYHSKVQRYLAVNGKIPAGKP